MVGPGKGRMAKSSIISAYFPQPLALEAPSSLVWYFIVFPFGGLRLGLRSIPGYPPSYHKMYNIPACGFFLWIPGQKSAHTRAHSAVNIRPYHQGSGLGGLLSCQNGGGALQPGSDCVAYPKPG